MEADLQYTLVRSKRKTISLRVEMNGSLSVRAPMGTPDAEIDLFVEKHRAWILRTRLRVRENAQRLVSLTAEQIALLQEQARVILPRKVAYYAVLMGLAPTGVQITSAEKRFGSCSGSGRLHFSYRLMLYPEAAMDYVVVHELAHLVHFDHSRAFYALIAKYLPDYKARAKLLGGRMPKY